MKIQLMTTAISSFLLLVSTIQDGSVFKYVYQIKANSYSPKDCVNLYYYKEKLIDKYEELTFTLKQSYVGSFLQDNISVFEFDSNCSSKYVNGVIVLTLGQGKGSVIEGKLRMNSCDDSVIREKIYLFDIFS